MDVEVSERKLIGSYANVAKEARTVHDKAVKELITKGKIPERGWSELQIERFLYYISSLDSNNFPSQVGAGEREGRVLCPLVAKRHYYLSHGVGRSGDVAAVQPKAAGSSLANKLCAKLVLDALKMCGIPSVKECFVLPSATGVALLMCLLSFKKQNPKATCVLWSRIDQKTCYKAIVTAGLKPVVFDTVLVGDELRTDVDGIAKALQEYGDTVLCVISTTSCFAPRVPDSVEELAVLCKEHNVAHLVNNAYGLQSTKCCHLIEQAFKKGRIDAFVQSTDKNFLVPVGGAVIAGFNVEIIDKIAKTYPGRASASPTIDLLSTLLWLGEEGWRNLQKDRKDLFQYLREKLCNLSLKHGERVLDTKSNQISLAFTLSQLDALVAASAQSWSLDNTEPQSNRNSHIPSEEQANGDKVDPTAVQHINENDPLSLSPASTETHSSQRLSHAHTASMGRAQSVIRVTELGSMLFKRNCTGARVVSPGNTSTIEGRSFDNWGAHSVNWTECSYLNAAAGVGMRREEVDTFVERMDRCLTEFKKRSTAV